MPMDPRFRACFKTITLREFGVALKGRPSWSLPCEYGMYIGGRMEEGGKMYLVEPMKLPDGSLGLRYSVRFRGYSSSSRPRRKVGGKDVKHGKRPVRERSRRWRPPGRRRQVVA